MAVLEMLTADGQPMELSFARGNVGTLVDIVAQTKNAIQIPAQSGGGGNIFINPE